MVIQNQIQSTPVAQINTLTVSVAGVVVGLYPRSLGMMNRSWLRKRKAKRSWKSEHSSSSFERHAAAATGRPDADAPCGPAHVIDQRDGNPRQRPVAAPGSLPAAAWAQLVLHPGMCS